MSCSIFFGVDFWIWICYAFVMKESTVIKFGLMRALHSSGVFGSAYGGCRLINCGLSDCDTIYLKRRRRDLNLPKFQELLTKKWNDKAIDLDGIPIMKDGVQMTYGELVIDRLFTDRKLTGELLNRMFGKGEVFEKDVEVRVLKPSRRDFTSIESRLKELSEDAVDNVVNLGED